ncbi:hypothetical protein [Arthrobacter sp. HLT1-20]
MTGKKGKKGSKKGGTSAPVQHRRGSAASTLKAIKWGAMAILVVGVLGAILGFAGVPLPGEPDNIRMEDVSVGLLMAGLFTPLGFMALWATVSQIWVDESGDWIRGENRTEVLLAAGLSVPLGALGLGIVLLGLSPLLMLTPGYGDELVDNFGMVIVALFLASVFLAATAAAMVMGGWKAGVVGVVFGLGFVSLVLGETNQGGLWQWMGWCALALGTAGFYFLGSMSGRLPLSFAKNYGSWFSIAGGAALTVWGIATGGWAMAAAGLFTIAAGLGLWFAGRVARKKGRGTSSVPAGNKGAAPLL